MKFDFDYFKAKHYKGFLLTSDLKIMFSSEPDVSFLDKDENLQLVIEIKGGKDKAGSLERYGAAKKSFQNTKMKYPDCKTILLMDSITTETQKRIQSDKSFDYIFPVNTLQKSNNFFQLIDFCNV